MRFIEKIRKNLIAQYTIITLVITVLVSFILGSVLTNRLTDQVIRTHISIFPSIVELMAKDHPDLYSFLRSIPGIAPGAEVLAVFRDIISFGSIFRLKVWAEDGTILWSDEEKLIGKNFRDNPELSIALQGTLSYELSLPRKEEQEAERAAGTILEIYIPVTQANRTFGVIELYERADELHQIIQKGLAFVWFFVAVSGLVLYISLFYIFYRTYRNERESKAQTIQTQDTTIFALAYQAELRDLETGKHLERTSLYVKLLAEELMKTPQYRSYLSSDYIGDLVRASPLHDIGKVGVADSILRKPGKLTPEEFQQMQKHCLYGAQVLMKAEERLKFQSFLKIAIQLTLTHHEKWNGDGYPNKLSGEQIPLSGRIMAIADVYDALRSERPYKGAFEHSKCREIILSEKGTHFDPLIVKAFLRREEDFHSISIEFQDRPSPERQMPA